jgi:hypothetical protein
MAPVFGAKFLDCGRKNNVRGKMTYQKAYIHPNPLLNPTPSASRSDIYRRSPADLCQAALASMPESKFSAQKRRFLGRSYHVYSGIDLRRMRLAAT